MTALIDTIRAELTDVFDADRANAIADLVHNAIIKHVGGSYRVVRDTEEPEPRPSGDPQRVAFVVCNHHLVRQHRDGKTPWCNSCGRTDAGTHHDQLAMLGRRPQ